MNTDDAQPTGGNPEADRRAKLHRLVHEFKVDPYGHRIDGLISLADARFLHDPAADGELAEGKPDRRPVVKVAGRVMLHRDTGKLIFIKLRDHTGDLQVAVSKRAVDETSFEMAKLADLGDIVAVCGHVGSTKTGEVTVWATTPAPAPADEAGASSTSDNSVAAFSIATKSLAPPPEKFKGLQDPELRYRKRYVDLNANPEAMRLMQLRIRIVDEIRAFLRGRGFMEVETPMLQPIHGGAAARPFTTHHNALDMPLFLRIAPELYLKRLLVAGLPKVFEINRNFRNEGISPRHNPEFTMLEAYEAFGSWQTMADLVEEMICTVAQNILGTLTIHHPGGRTINLQRPWRRISMVDLVAERTGWKFDKRSLFELGPATQQGVAQAMTDEPRREGWLAHLQTLSPAEQLVDVYERIVEPTLIDPTFVTHVPSVIIPLAKENPADPFFADVYELAINGVEISPGYTELNDPDVQERHFRHQVGEREEQQQIDEDFLEALRVGMPPAGGMGLGVDRLVMMLTGAPSIRDVIFFPLMRPQG